MKKIIQAIVGPRIPPEELRRRGLRYASPTIVLSIARIALLISIFLPYWRMELIAPQYPDGLHVQAYLNRLEGDVREIDGLNHYIGMRPLGDAARLERSLSIFGLLSLVLLVEGATYIHTRWAAIFIVPAVVFPPFFLLDLYYWLNTFGQNLDPSAALSKSIEPFTPPVLGTGLIGQFETHASMGPGLQLACLTAVLCIAGLWLHRRAYKPLVELAGKEAQSE